MLKKNIGNIERVFRLLFAVTLSIWITTQQHLNGMEWFVLSISVMMILNGVFARCYLWYILDINTLKKTEKREEGKPQTQCL